MVMETGSMSHYFNSVIYADMQEKPGFDFPTLEFRGFEANAESPAPDVYFTHIQHNCCQTSAQNLTLETQFESRFNSVFSHPALAELLRADEIEFALMDAFEQLLFNADDGFVYSEAVANAPVFEALFDCNIVYKGKYSTTAETPQVKLCHEPVMRPVVTEWLQS